MRLSFHAIPRSLQTKSHKSHPESHPSNSQCANHRNTLNLHVLLAGQVDALLPHDGLEDVEVSTGTASQGAGETCQYSCGGVSIQHMKLRRPSRFVLSL